MRPLRIIKDLTKYVIQRQNGTPIGRVIFIKQDGVRFSTTNGMIRLSSAELDQISEFIKDKTAQIAGINNEFNKENEG